MCYDPRDYNKDGKPVPCGKCPVCRGRRVSAWSFRLMQEYNRCDSAQFITLTYDNICVPITERGFMSLSKRDLQVFFKRLRKNQDIKDDAEGRKRSGQKIRYYVAGEYGGKTKRPHYHIILFDAKIDLICPSWQYGDIHYGFLSEASVGYTLKYINKDKRERKPYWYSDQIPEFALMSKGIGSNYITDRIRRWHIADIENRCYVNIGEGKKATMARYYKDKMYTYEERLKIAQAGLERNMGRWDHIETEEDYRDYKEAVKAAYEKQKVKNSKMDKL